VGRTYWSNRRRRGVGAAAALLVVGAATVVTAGNAIAGPNSDPDVVAASVAPNNGRECTTSRLPVDLEVGTPATPGSDLTLPLGGALGQQEVVVKLCVPENNRSTSAVQVLTHGITYDHRYWNIADPDDPEGDRYSWEAAAAEAGYATASIDRIGNGDSTHPPSPAVTIDSNATAMHQVVQALRTGEIEGPDGTAPAFGKVALVGHSYGSMTSWTTASRYQDVDALLLTGVSHNIREVQVPTSIEGSMHPAILDPRFAGSNLDLGYITPRPGTHRNLYYAPGIDVDPRIIERDEATKGSVTQSELMDYPVIFRTRLDVQAPVFIINGSLDGIFCTQGPLDLGAPCDSPESLVENERQWFGPDVPSIDAYIVDGAGHDLNAFRDAQETFGASMNWLSGVMPS